MKAPRPSLHHLAMAVVATELSRSGAGHEASVAERSMVRLHEHFGKLIGPTGFDVLLARSLVLARRAHPLLSSCEAGFGGQLSWLPDAVNDSDRASAESAAVVLLAHLFELLARLLGEELSMRLVHDVWPDLPDTRPARDET